MIVPGSTVSSGIVTVPTIPSGACNVISIIFAFKTLLWVPFLVQSNSKLSIQTRVVLLMVPVGEVGDATGVGIGEGGVDGEKEGEAVRVREGVGDWMIEIVGLPELDGVKEEVEEGDVDAEEDSVGENPGVGVMDRLIVGDPEEVDDVVGVALSDILGDIVGELD